jgi:ABC-type antimicrobial peptide transport system permease subunit
MPLMTGGQMADALTREVRNQQLFGTMLAWLSTLAMVLAAVGLHGLVAQTTMEREREFGIRMAVGAGRGDIAGLVGRYVLTITVLGTVAGIACAAFGSRLIESMLFGVAAVDPAAYAIAVGVLACIVGLAATWPAVRATRVQPVDVLRME